MPKIIGPILLLVIFSASAQEQTLWRKTVAGMSPAEVTRRVPEATPPKGLPNTLEDGAVELLKIPSFALVNQPFSASFYFKRDKLTQVMLSLLTPSTFDSALLTFDSLTEALRAKYGPEISRSRNFFKAEAMWISGRTNITLILFSVAPGAPIIFNLNYQVRLAHEADKL